MTAAHRSKLALLLALLTPTVAVACGMCMERVLRREHWWLAALPVLAGATVVEALFWSAFAHAGKRPWGLAWVRRLCGELG